MSLKRKKFVKSFAIVTAFTLITKVLSFVFKIYLSRKLGAEVLGLYQICTTIFYLFAAISLSGAPLIVSRKIAELPSSDKKTSFSYCSSALLFCTLLTIALYAILKIASPGLDVLFKDKRAIPLFWIMAPALLTTTIYNVIRGWFWGREEFVVFSFSEFFEEFIRIVISVILISGFIANISGEIGMALGFLISDVAICVILVAIYFGKGGRIVKPAHTKEILAPSVPITLMRVVGNLSGSIIAVIFPALLMSGGMSVNEATASYGRVAGMALPIIVIPATILASLSIVMIPELSRASHNKNYPALNSQINSALIFSVLLAGLSMCLFIPLGKELTLALYNDEISGIYLSVVSIMILPMNIAQLTQTAMNSIGLETKSFLNYLIGIVLMFISVILLTKPIGIYSAGVGNIVSFTVCSILNLKDLNKQTSLSMKFLKPTAKILLACLPIGALCYNLYNILDDYFSRLFILLICFLFVCFSYFVTITTFNLADINGFIKISLTKLKKQKA